MPDPSELEERRRLIRRTLRSAYFFGFVALITLCVGLLDDDAVLTGIGIVAMVLGLIGVTFWSFRVRQLAGGPNDTNPHSP